MADNVRLIKHEAVPGCGSFGVHFPDSRAPRFFYFDDLPSRRRRPELLTREQAFEQGEIGPDLFHHACLMGLEGLVSKHRDSSYRAGRFDRWVKNKNRAHPAFSRVMDNARLSCPYEPPQ